MKKVTQEELDRFNELCNLPIKVTYGNSENYQTEYTEVSLGYYFIVKSLRDMEKKDIRRLLYDTGHKAVLTVATISLEISVDTLQKDNFGKADLPWRVILA